MASAEENLGPMEHVDPFKVSAGEGWVAGSNLGKPGQITQEVRIGGRGLQLPEAAT